MIRPRLLAVPLLLALLTACHSPATQSQSTQSQGGQSQYTPPTTIAQPAPARTQPAPTRAAPTRTGSDPTSGLPYIAVSALPPQGQQTLRLIEAGGPFPYSRDGIVFQNRERVLPRRSSGTYHEYTVRTPGSSDRGARRIICAALTECYYTADHYASFERISQ